ncbi:MAG: GNAT family N-acetyltransferase [Caldilinea sp.]|nr:GNAT family N-acetyltransferase [Caldilinea sp.]MDW8441277.1 GNAT family N-acetyltransferase [Caldilineaceae bacterium]
MLQRPILLDLPDQLESERLWLRAPRPGDGATINQAVRESFEALRPWLPWATTLPTVAESEEFARRSAVSYLTREAFTWLLWNKQTGRLIGVSSLHDINWSVPSMQIGYWVRTSMAGQGCITEAVLTVSHFAFDVLGARRVEIRCDERNERSAAVARRAGFVLEGVLHNERRHHISHELCNTMVFAVIKAPS